MQAGIGRPWPPYPCLHTAHFRERLASCVKLAARLRHMMLNRDDLGVEPGAGVQRARTRHAVGDNQKVARNSSMSTYVSSPGSWEAAAWLSEKQPSRSWTKPSTFAGGLGAGVCQRPQ